MSRQCLYIYIHTHTWMLMLFFPFLLFPQQLFQGSSSDLVPTLMDIFDSMIGNQHDLAPDQSATMMTGNLSILSQQQQQQRHFPVLKIVEPGDPEPVSPLNGISHLSIFLSFVVAWWRQSHLSPVVLFCFFFMKNMARWNRWKYDDENSRNVSSIWRQRNVVVVFFFFVSSPFRLLPFRRNDGFSGHHFERIVQVWQFVFFIVVDVTGPGARLSFSHLVNSVGQRPFDLPFNFGWKSGRRCHRRSDK